MTTTRITDTCPDCGCEAPAHYPRCPRLSPAVRAFAAEQEREMTERQAEREASRATTDAAKADRQRKFDAMKRQISPHADDTTVYGLPLKSMNADEIRIAALWLASQFPKGIAPHHG